MIKPKLNFSFAPVLLGLIFGGAALGQGVNLSVVQGNGQLICDGCAFAGAFNIFDPLIVRVTDAGGKPVAGATVNWTVITGGGFLSAQTTTGSDSSSAATLCTAIGQSCNTYTEGVVAGFGTQTFIQSSITASLATSGQSVTFYLTQSPNPQEGTLEQAQPILTSAPNVLYTGTAGGATTPPITVQVSTFSGTPLSKVSVRIVPGPDVPSGSASISCATGPGADPGSVLTDSTGNAICNPVLGPVPSKGQTVGPFTALVGGVSSVQSPGLNDANGQPYRGRPAGFAAYGTYSIVVNAATVGGITVVSGNNQSANPGAALAAPLVADVVDANGNPLAGQQVTWTVSPAAAAKVSSNTSTSDTTGQVSTTVTLSASAAGSIQVIATTSNGKTLTFTVTVNLTITGITKVSGDNQSAPAGANFPQSLVVQVGTPAGQSAAGIQVQFSSSGAPATLSASSAVTDSSGQARVNVQAGTTPGTITVTATVSGSSVSFTLTVIPPGPSISGASFLNGAGFFPSSGNNQTALSPCGIATLVNGTPLSAAPAAPNLFAAPNQQPTGVTISFLETSPVPAASGTPAPILSVSGSSSSQQLITFQVPCELAPASYTVTVTVNGGSKDVLSVPVRPAAPGIFEIPMSDGIRRALLVKLDGSFVSLQNPARRAGGGEIIRMYITGAGPVQPPLNTNSLPTPGVDSNPVDPTSIVVGVNSSGVRVVLVRAVPNLIGVYEIAFQVPPDAPAGNDVVLSVGITTEGNPTQYTQGSRIPIQ